jgi:hypothetical protein
MLTDPLPIDSSYITAADIPRISSEQNKSVYRLTVSSTDYTVSISHQYAKGRRRSVVRLDAKKIVSDPYVDNNNVEDTTSTYLVIDRSERLVTDSDVTALVSELLGGVLAHCTNANAVTTRLASIVGGQS